MGLGAYPASGRNWLGMLGMHGTFEANNAMHDCDLMIAVGARFDDRITGRLDAFSPGSTKIHIDIDPSSINKNVKVDLGIVGDCAHVLEDMRARSGASAQSQVGRAAAQSLVVADRRRGGRASRSPSRIPQRSSSRNMPIAAALCSDQGPRHLHHDRSRPAPDVGRPALSFRGAEPAA